MNIIKYSSSMRSQWNNFVKSSKNATFLLHRDYMDYHKERFNDFSLMIYNEKNILIALLPASYKDDTLTSHAGLTYGGFLTNHTIKSKKMIDIFTNTILFLKKEKIKYIIYKSIPHIYHKFPAEEDLYALFRFKFHLYRRDISSTINMKTTSIKGQKINGYKKAKQIGMKLEETIESFEILTLVNNNLNKKYNTHAVHTHKEMDFLKSKFKNNIKLYKLVLDNNIIGGAILYIDNDVVHAQYITTNENAKKNRGLDFIIVSIINLYKSTQIWFDFGISTENDGNILNESLIKSKEEFNMSAICYDSYKLEIK